MDKNLYVYDNTTNKNVRLTSSSDGKLNVKNIQKTLKQYRREGKCYYGTTSNFTDVAENYLLTLRNPTGSGYTAGLYNVQWNTSTNATTGNTLKYSLYTLDGFTIGGSALKITRRNVKFGEPNDEDIELYDGINGSASIHGTLMSSYLEPSSSSGGLYQYLDFQEEIVQIPEGYGVTLLMTGNDTSRLVLQYGVTFRYIKVPNSEEL